MMIGDRVRKRGKSHCGTVYKVNLYRGWVSVFWDEGTAPVTRPTLCTMKELEPAK